MTDIRMVGKAAPHFSMDAVFPNLEFGKVSLDDYKKDGKWTVLFFYPMDFTFICPTEITSLSDHYDEFAALNAEIIGVSTDTVLTHKAWINTPREDNGLGSIKFPLASDKNHRVSSDYGVLIKDEGIALRGLFIIDPAGELKYSVVHDNDIGRDVKETLRVLQALQTGALCPANWQPGDATVPR